MIADCVAMNGLTVTALKTGPGVHTPGVDVATVYKAASENFALAKALDCRIITIQNGAAVPGDDLRFGHGLIRQR